MSSHTSSGNTPAARPWGNAIATVLVCVLIGPPLGSLMFAAAMSFMPGLWGATPPTGIDVGGALSTVLFVGLFGIPFAFLIGGLQALATGLAFSAYGWRRGRPPLWFAVATAAAVFGAATLLKIVDDPDMMAPMALVHVVPVLICWLIIRAFWPKAAA